MRVELIADSEYFDGFSTWLKNAGIELVEQEAEVILDLSFLDPEEKLRRLRKLEISSGLLITNTLTISTTKVAESLENVAVTGCPILPGYSTSQKMLEFSLPIGKTEVRDKATEFFKAIGKESELISDSVGGIFPRSIAMIVNEAAFALQESVATAPDIDQAMKLGTNYPKGPLALCDEIGAKAIVAVLDALGKEYGQDRYRPAALLRRHAEAGLKFYQ